MTLQITGNNINGSPELIISGGTGAVFSWSPFGGSVARTGEATSLPGFNGERQDPLSGVTHLGNGYRAYSPALRRFTCPDSESPFGVGGINPYVYCDHDPVNRTDPDGHQGRSIFRKFFVCGSKKKMGVTQENSLSLQVATREMTHPGTAASSQTTTGILLEVIEERKVPASIQQFNGIIEETAVQKSSVGNNHEELTQQHFSSPDRVTHVLAKKGQEPTLPLKFMADDFYREGNKHGVSTEAERQFYRDHKAHIKTEILSEISRTQPGNNLGPVQNAMRRSSEIISEAIEYGYRVDIKGVQTGLVNYLMSLVTSGFKDEDTTGTLTGERSGSSWGGHFNYKKLPMR